jgi:TetR/AcrR family transcriptional regulator, transcriptional repressor for nem operon
MTTRNQLIELAQKEIQTKGYVAFSYADLSAALGITKASIHYHFPAKADLGQEVARRYTNNFRLALEEIYKESADAHQHLQGYAQVFINNLYQNRVICAGMMLASDRGSLPEKVLVEVQTFITLNETWLEKVLEEGQQQNILSFTDSARDVASTIFTALEGAMLISRADSNPIRLHQVSQWLINQLLITKEKET